MAFTGDLEHLPIVDIIQLVNTTRKSGIFSVNGGRGESTIVFRNGYIVGANHLDNSVRIGTVLVKTGAITVDDLKRAMAVMKQAGSSHLPLLTTLVQTGVLKPEDALRGLKKLVEMTIVELMGWTSGTFTFDTETAVVPSQGEQDLEVDAQMVLMDALRIFDERERDRRNGKEVPAIEELYADVVPEESVGDQPAAPAVTADDLGLADLDRLEKKIPRPLSDLEIFDPAAIRQQKVKELLPGFSEEEQELFFSFLRKSADRKAGPGAAAKQAGKAVVLFSADTLICHAVMSLFTDEGMLVFATHDAKELDRTVSQCLLAAKIPVVVFDSPGGPETGIPRDAVADLRRQVSAKYSAVPVIQFAPARDGDLILESYRDGVRAVFPRPVRDEGKGTYIRDTIAFLEAFRSYVAGFRSGQDDIDLYGRKLKDGVASLRSVTNPSDAALVVLTAVSEMFERAVTLVVRGSELVGERAIGIMSDKSLGPAPADRLKVSLAQPSVFREAVEKERAVYRESGDETLRAFFTDIGRPASPSFLLLPLMSERRVVAVVYADFGQREASAVRLDLLEILAMQAGIVLEYAVFRRQAARSAQKS